MKQTIEQIKKLFNLDEIVTLDFETFFRSRAKSIPNPDGGKAIKIKSYSLKSKAYWDYIMDDQFGVTQFAYSVDDADPIVLDPLDVDEYLQSIRKRIEEGERIGLVCQNTQFDGCISSWRFGVKWTMYFDTLLLSRQQYTGQSGSLKNQCIRMFPDDETMRKGNELVQADDVPCYHEAGIYDTIAEYNKQDVILTRALFVEYFNACRTPLLEWHIMHYTLRGCIEAHFRVDIPLLQETSEKGTELADNIIANADAYLATLGKPVMGRIQYSSDLKFKALLRTLGINIPMKMDKKTFEMKPALAQTDPTYVKVKQEYPEHKVLFQARAIAKSNSTVSRADKMIECAQKIGKGYFVDDAIGMYLNYNAAHTGRWSGGEKINQQNLGRGSNHRLALRTPKGMQNVVCDLSNIELRQNLWFCEEDQLQKENHAGDIYCTMATQIYGEDVPPKSKWTPDQKLRFGDYRQVGKVSELGMQYGMSGGTFQSYMAGGPMGMEPVFFADSFCKQVKNAYDTMHPLVVQMWRSFQNLVMPALCGNSEPVRIGRGGCLLVSKGEIKLPSGRILLYKDMYCKQTETRNGFSNEYRYDDGKRDRFQNIAWMYTYGARVFQNCIQALARDVIAFQQHECELYLQDKGFGYIIGSVHDELLCNVWDEHVLEAQAGIERIMRIPPDWCKEIPLDVESGFDSVYSK